MAISNAISGIGTVIQIGDGATTEVFTTIPEVSNITFPDFSRDLIDVTALDSTSGYKENIAGFRDGGQVVLEMNWTRAVFDTLKTNFDASGSVNFKIIMPDTGSTEYDFAAWVTNIGGSIPTDDKISMTATLKVDGPIIETS